MEVKEVEGGRKVVGVRQKLLLPQHRPASLHACLTINMPPITLTINIHPTHLSHTSAPTHLSPRCCPNTHLSPWRMHHSATDRRWPAPKEVEIHSERFAERWEGRYKASWKSEIHAPMAQGRSATIIAMIHWTRTSRLSIKISLSFAERADYGLGGSRTRKVRGRELPPGPAGGKRVVPARG